ncbi:MAG: DUF6702 family protein [Rubripirellula sp.]
MQPTCMTSNMSRTIHSSHRDSFSVSLHPERRHQPELRIPTASAVLARILVFAASCWCAFVSGSPLHAAPVHPVHETVAEVEWNATTGRLEVALRLDVLDEQWLRQRLSGDKPTQRWALEYLQKKFRIRERPDAGREDVSSYHWVGREQKGAHVWWFFEIEPDDKQPAQWIEQQMLFEREPNYTHRVLILGLPTKRSLNLTARRPKTPLTSRESSPVESNELQDDAKPQPVDR